MAMKPDFKEKTCPADCPYRHFTVFEIRGAEEGRYFCTQYHMTLRKRLVNGKYRVYKTTDCIYEV